ncbi:MAG TPA: hypothetical protein PKE04_23305, partial [Clostridia bacterium]|nr:hypothetical protein [Clostridia bacterium]
MISLRNDVLRADFTDQGALIHLENVRDGVGNIIAVPASGLFRMVLQWGDNWEHAVLPQEQAVTASGNDSETWFRLDRVHTEERDFDVSVTLHARLDGDGLR